MDGQSSVTNDVTKINIVHTPPLPPWLRRVNEMCISGRAGRKSNHGSMVQGSKRVTLNNRKDLRLPTIGLGIKSDGMVKNRYYTGIIPQRGLSDRY